MKVLFVCLGNICRSPIAEGVMKQQIKILGLNWNVDSAGTNGLHLGEAPHRYSQAVCLEHQIDISDQRARAFVINDINEFDLIYAMAPDVLADIKKVLNGRLEKVKLFLDENPDTTLKAVPDPWYGDKDGYLPVYQLIEQTCNYILQNHISKSSK
jgi:protein-tyrosine phosphatase